ncbi:MAG: WD40 repeat domain-containing protein [Anaerolineae bacterium]
MSVPPRPPSPYKGLMPYSEGDARFFFGRDNDRDLIIANLTAARLTLLYGPSGVGKSSVLRAGVRYTLVKEAAANLAGYGAPEMAVVYFNSWRDDPLPGLLRAVEGAAREALTGFNVVAPTATDFVEALDGWTDVVEGPLLIILDQFEEYFLYHAQDDGPGTFAFEFPRAVTRRGLRVAFLAALREDALANLDHFKGRIPNLFDNRLRVDHLNAAAAEMAIRGPLAEWNTLVPPGEAMSIEDDLVKAVLEQVQRGAVLLGDTGRGQAAATGGDVGIETPFLQLVMTRLWDEETRQGSHVLRLATLQALGGAARIVRTHLDAAMATLSPTEQKTAAGIFHYLVTPSATKIAHTVSDLAVYADATPDDIRPVVERLSQGDLRILRPIAPPPGQAGETRYEIYHDVLAPAVLDWRARYQREQDRAEAEAKAAEERQAAEVRLAAEQARVTRLRLTLLGVTALLALVIVLAVFAWTQRAAAVQATAEAEQQRAVAETQREAAVRAQATAEAARTEAERQRTEAEVQRAAAVQAQATAEFNARQAESRALAASALARLAVDPAESVQLAVKANTTARTAEAEEALRRSLPESYVRRILRGAPSGVWTASYSPDGTRIVTARADNTAEVFDVDSGRRVGVLQGHTDGLNGAAFSPDGGRIVTAGADGTARVWDATTFQPLATISQNGSEIYKAAFSPDGKLVATASKDKTARLSDAATGAAVWVSPPSDGAVVDVVFSPDGQFLVASSLNGPDGAGNDQPGVARVYRVSDGEQVAELGRAGLGRTQYGGVWQSAFSPDGTRVVTASEDNTARVWEVGSWRLLSELSGRNGHSGRVSHVAFSPDNRLILTTSADNTGRVWDAVSGDLKASLVGHTSYVVDGAFSPDSRAVITAGLDGVARVWDAATGRELAVLRGHTAGVFSTMFDKTGQFAITSSGDGTARIWQAPTRPSLYEMRATDGLTTLAFSPTGGLLATVGRDGGAQVWNTGNGQVVARLSGHQGAVQSLDISRDGNRIVTGGADGTARVWDARSGSSLLELPVNAAVNAVAFSQDGKRIVTAAKDGKSRVWDAGSGRQVAEMQVYTDSVSSAAFSPDGSRIVTAANDKTVRVWDADSGRQIAALDGPKQGVTAAAFSPDGKLLAAAGRDWKIWVWNSAANGQPWKLSGHTGPVQTLAFSPDSGLLVTTAGWPDYSARVWNAATGVQIAELDGHTNLLHSAVFDPSGRWIVTASEDGTTRVWEAATGKSLAVLRGATRGVADAAFSPDGSLIAAVGESKDDPVAHLYRCDVCGSLESMLQQAGRLPIP